MEPGYFCAVVYLSCFLLFNPTNRYVYIFIALPIEQFSEATTTKHSELNT